MIQGQILQLTAFDVLVSDRRGKPRRVYSWQRSFFSLLRGDLAHALVLPSEIFSSVFHILIRDFLRKRSVCVPWNCRSSLCSLRRGFRALYPQYLALGLVAACLGAYAGAQVRHHFRSE
jgi:hypothetical protein